MELNHYDSWKLQTPEEHSRLSFEIVCECEQCGEALFAGDEVIEDTEDNIFFCDMNCFDDYMRETRVSHTTLEALDPREDF